MSLHMKGIIDFFENEKYFDFQKWTKKMSKFPKPGYFIEKAFRLTIN